METLGRLILSKEDWLLAKAIELAKEFGYYSYTSQCEDAWRLAIQGFSSAITECLKESTEPMELSVEEDYRTGPAGDFAIHEAKLHRKRGTSLPMFMGMTKYFRQAYIDLIDSTEKDAETRQKMRKYILRFFDRVELGFASAWADILEAQLRECC